MPNVCFRISLLCLLIGTSLFGNLSAQDRASFGRFELGLSFLNLDAANQALIDTEYNPLTSTMFTLGGSWDAIHGKWVYGGKAYGFMVSQSDLQNQVAILEYFYGQLHTGYVVYGEEKLWNLYPTVGIGWGGANLKTKPWTKQRPVPHWATGFMLDFALNSRHYFVFDTENKDDFMLELGASIGYTYAMEGTNMWSLDEFVPDERLVVNPEGIYIRLSIGMGRFK